MRNKLYARWGVLLGRISKESLIPKKDLHRAFVAAKGRESLKEFTDTELTELIIEIIAYMATEYGIEIYFSRGNLEDMTLTELFNYYLEVTVK